MENLENLEENGYVEEKNTTEENTVVEMETLDINYVLETLRDRYAEEGVEFTYDEFRNSYDLTIQVNREDGDHILGNIGISKEVFSIDNTMKGIYRFVEELLGK